jgi:hypothetical protein
MEETIPLPTTLRTWRYANLASVAASAVQTFPIETSNNIHAILLYFASAVPAPLTRAQLITDVATIRAWLNGDLIYDRTATQALDEYKYHFDKFGALAAPLGAIVIPFMNFNLPIFDHRRGYALGMLNPRGGNNNLELEVVMTAGVATAATCEIHVISDVYPPEQTGLHMRRLRTTRDMAATGDIYITNLPRDYYGIATLAIVTAAGNLDRFSVTKNREFIFKETHLDVHRLAQDMAGRTPQAGYEHIDFSLGNDLHSIERLAGAVGEWNVIPHALIAPGLGTVILTEEVHTTIRS